MEGFISYLLKTVYLKVKHLPLKQHPSPSLESLRDPYIYILSLLVKIYNMLVEYSDLLLHYYTHIHSSFIIVNLHQGVSVRLLNLQEIELNFPQITLICH
ncbi:Hypothetical predicted protein [Octopus vulgaris]|uniref:Uncharacterized protein n=1 Tax=Octopus vulgaris TaxID=6645 RepID=A0AA36FGI2_OCTVU|nr:Hypothetical predicted protein [Octopus vulgaris]